MRQKQYKYSIVQYSTVCSLLPTRGKDMYIQKCTCKWSSFSFISFLFFQVSLLFLSMSQEHTVRTVQSSSSHSDKGNKELSKATPFRRSERHIHAHKYVYTHIHIYTYNIQHTHTQMYTLTTDTVHNMSDRKIDAQTLPLTLLLSVSLIDPVTVCSCFPVCQSMSNCFTIHVTQAPLSSYSCSEGFFLFHFSPCLS